MILKGETIIHAFDWALISSRRKTGWELYKQLRQAEKLIGSYAESIRRFYFEKVFLQALKRRDSIK